ADDAFPRGFDVITIDTSFISVVTVLDRARAYLRPPGSIVALVKPQFEAGPRRLRRGVVRDPDVHRAILRDVARRVGDLGLVAGALAASPLRGAAGNREFFMLVGRRGEPLSDARIEAAVAEESEP
ncbi:MAG: TlyA family rRNA (cytidine-2'-O)-methyltransferase, partial [Candidatus Eremiobacteraeota bacterium]|nr:TlyA family rRNA (cytidine-2'-O)-methyltransferase [Candidatus Eremiobacteraeota bacterium]